MGEGGQQFIRDGSSSIDIYAVLKDRIVKGVLAGGTPLKQTNLAAEFGVSKIPVREALRQLESAGLVEFRPRRGAIVIELSAEDVLDLLDVRLALECRALELAIPNMVDDEISLAHEILEEYSDESEIEGWSKLNVRFHNSLYAACDRPHLLSYIDDVKNRMGAYLQFNVTMARGFSRPHEEHQQLLAACEARDVDAAVQILRTHIETTQKEVLAFIRREHVGSFVK